MPAPRLLLLLGKEIRELLAAKSYWLLLLVAGLLAGHAALTAFGTYAEMSGAGGGPSALREGLDPLDGIVIPIAGSLSLVATLLLPFVVIRQVGHERTTGAWKLLVQGPATIGRMLMIKVLTLLAGWLVAWIPVVAALGLWVLAGNHLDGRETLSVGLGQFLFAWLTIGVAAAAAALSDNEATAAIVALGVTIGGWALELLGAMRGGLFSTLAGYTPATLLGQFEQGLISAPVLIGLLLLGLLGVLLAGLWLRGALGTAPRIARTVLATLLVFAGIAAGSRLRVYADWSEDRRNSFSPADEALLRSIREPLRLDIRLAPEDPRLLDLRRGVLGKLERTLPGLQVTNPIGTGTGMFERGESYGQITYTMGARSTTSRATTPAIFLENIYELAGKTAPTVPASGYPGYPLVRQPRWTSTALFVAWPTLVIGGFLFQRSRRNRVS